MSVSVAGLGMERHWQAQVARRRWYTALCLGLLLLAFLASVQFANEASAGKFFDRLPYFFDFLGDFVPRDGWEVWRALFDRPSPYADGSFKYDYEVGRVYLTESFYLPEYVFKMLETINVAILATLIGTVLGFLLCFLAAGNLNSNRWVRGTVRRFLEITRAFPEIVIAGFFVAILSLGPIPAMIAIAIHTIGALGKLFFEVVENADMQPVEGLQASGAGWMEQVRFAVVPQIMPNIVSYTLLRLEINVRASTIIGAVGGGGIGEALRLSISRGHEAKTLAIILLLFSTIVLVDHLSAHCRKRLTGSAGWTS